MATLSPHALPPDQPPDRRTTPRALVESTVCLLVAVILFRTFAAEGYMISTGSMAPHLLGFHKRVVCPTCRTPFPFGVAYDTDVSGMSAAETEAARNLAVCPNCGQDRIRLTNVPRNHGDQLLVFKPAYALTPPKRWEVVVFRNPHNPTEAYVKRLVGLPGEAIQILDGDVYADGVLCRKDWPQQRALRIVVHEHRYQPAADARCRPHWQPVPGPTSAPSWRAEGDRFVLEAPDDAQDGWSWVEYGHWYRRQPRQETSVTLAAWPGDLEPSSIPPAGLKYDLHHQRLSCVGALSEAVRDRLLAHPADAAFHRAIHELYEQSHVGPIRDTYGYNPAEGDHQPVPVRDVMVSLHVHVAQGRGEFAVEMSDGAANYTAVFDWGRREARLYAGTDDEPVASTALPPEFFAAKPCTIEMSLFDRQVLVAWNEQPLLGPWTFDVPEATPVPRYPMRFGAHRLHAVVSDLVVYRDVYYTATRGRHGVLRPYRLGPDELFVLGDNSPVSHDSRRWPDGAVPRSLLIGKPFLVHLPSKPVRLRIGRSEWHLRLPDWERIHWLR
jgi:signal peptidase I